MQSSHLHHVWDYRDVDRAFWQEHIASWLPRRIVDAHVHATDPARRLVKPDETMRRSYWVCEVSEPQTVVDLHRCQQIVYPGREVSAVIFGHPMPEYDLDGMNADTAAECASGPDHGLAVVRPSWSAEKIGALLDSPGIIGVKPYYALIGPSGIGRDTYIEASIFDFLPHHQLEVLNDRRAWVTLHVPRAERLPHPDNLREVRELRSRYPDVSLVVAHFGRCYTEPHARAALPALSADLGLYFDNSAVLNPAVHRLAFEVLGPERILYGTDNPVFYMRGRRQWRGTRYINRTSHPFFFNKVREPREIEAAYTLYMYEALRAIGEAARDVGLSGTDLGAVFHGNAERLLARADVGTGSGSDSTQHRS
ncbi:MAG: amidohydrolase family protein [Kiritimatiellaeota bacterium]|nr:amidohydrolase family protein [Kiritimatiellota bacterium]